jgi:cytochrome c peroxidase
VHGARGVPRCDAKGSPKVDTVYGLGVQVTTRKPPSYLDAMFLDALFWDGRAPGQFSDPTTGSLAIAKGGALESQAVAPLMNPVEMACEGYGWSDLASKLARVKPLALATHLPPAMADAITLHPGYPDLFQWAYGTQEITAPKIAFAIATHERQLTSSDTPWDRFNAGDTTALTENQRAGLIVFNLKGNCGKCHVPPLFTDGKFHNIAFVDPTLDPGRSAITMLATDLGRMKTPTLRNVGLRARGGLMHNGTFNGATLQAVLTAYNQGGGNDRNNIDPLMDRLDLTENQSDSLRDFLENALTDARVRNAAAPFDRPRLSTEP